MFNQAFKLDRCGDWPDAIDLYEQIADISPDPREGQYARNCAQHIREKMQTSD
jgi:hypothetical protein